jgi:hypothetical protein
MNSIENKLASTNSKLSGMLATLLMALGLFALAASVQAGGTATTIFDTLATTTDAAIFGPLGQTIIAGGAAAGGIFAIIKGAWMLAGLGIAIAALMFGAQLVANSSGFGAMI